MRNLDEDNITRAVIGMHANAPHRAHATLDADASEAGQPLAAQVE
jgi:hypothetical protein